MGPFTAALPRLATTAVVGVLAGVVTASLASTPFGILTGIAAMATTFVVTSTFALWPMDAAATCTHARRASFRPLIQVSDTSISGSALRSVVMRHCIMAYVFSTVILAATINLVAGVITG